MKRKHSLYLRFRAAASTEMDTKFVMLSLISSLHVIILLPFQRANYLMSNTIKPKAYSLNISVSNGINERIQQKM